MATDVGSTGDDAGAGTAAEMPTSELPSQATPDLSAVPAAPSEDRCTACGAPLAHDQRYCVECGERRGGSTLPKSQPAVEVRSRRTRPRAAARAPRFSAGATLVSGVAVLLLAIGLGVLIGRIGNHTTTTRAASPATVIMQGGGTGTAASTPTATTTTKHITKKAKGKLNAAAKTTPLPPPAVQKKAAQAAAKVLGNSNNLPPPNVSVGGSCKHGAGCQGGKFTGNFFPTK